MVYTLPKKEKISDAVYQLLVTIGEKCTSMIDGVKMILENLKCDYRNYP